MRRLRMPDRRVCLGDDHRDDRNLQRLGVQIRVVACNTAMAVLHATTRPSAEPPQVPVVSVIVPRHMPPVQATRNGRIGLLATELTVASGRDASRVQTLDAGARFVAVPCPKLVPLIEAGDTFSDEAVRRFASTRAAEQASARP